MSKLTTHCSTPIARVRDKRKLTFLFATQQGPKATVRLSTLKYLGYNDTFRAHRDGAGLGGRTEVSLDVVQALNIAPLEKPMAIADALPSRLTDKDRAEIAAMKLRAGREGWVEKK